MKNERRVYIIRGEVQGVGFRAFVRDWARRLALTGWVRNREDGRTVEVLAEGPPERLQRLEGLLQTGPPASHVGAVESVPGIATGEFSSFEIRR
jgi:acylphosphatase